MNFISLPFVVSPVIKINLLLQPWRNRFLRQWIIEMNKLFGLLGLYS